MTDLHTILENIWDDGNAVGLDGWVGPGRGTEPIDEDAIRARDRAIEAAVTALLPEFAYAGPQDTPAGTLLDVAWKLRNGYDAGGSNVRAGVAELLETIVHAFAPGRTSSYEGQPRAERWDQLETDMKAQGAAEERAWWVEKLAALCDDEWLRLRDRAMLLPGSRGHRWHQRGAAVAEHAATTVRLLLRERAGDLDVASPAAFDSYRRWMGAGRDHEVPAGTEGSDRG